MRRLAAPALGTYSLLAGLLLGLGGAFLANLPFEEEAANQLSATPRKPPMSVEGLEALYKPKHADAVSAFIRAAGYDCESVDTMTPNLLSEGVTVACNGHRYLYSIENHGGILSMKQN
jgi:hypothetical protein